jgi:hypothetical protein
MVLSSGLQCLSRVSLCFLLCNASPFLCVRLLSNYEALWWPMYWWCTGLCCTVVLGMCSVGANFLHFSLFTICLHCVWSILANTCHSYDSLCYVVTIRAALYLYCGFAVMFHAMGVGSVLGWVS